MDGTQSETTGRPRPLVGHGVKTALERSRARKAPSSGKRTNGEAELAAELHWVDWEFFKRASLCGENIAYSLHDGSGRFLDATDGCELIWGHSLREIRNYSVSELLHPNKEFVEWLLNLEPETSSASFSVLIGKEGELLTPALVKRIPLFIGADQKQTRIVLKALVSPNAQEAISPNAKLLRSSHSLDGACLETNPLWTEILGVPEHTLKADGLFNRVHPEDTSPLKQMIEEARDLGQSSWKIIRFLAASQQERSLLIQAQRPPLSKRLHLKGKDLTVDPANPVATLMAIRSELHREGLLFAIPSDSQWSIVHANQTFERITGFNSEAIFREGLSLLVGPQTDPSFPGQLEASIKASSAWQKELILRRNDGSAFWGKVSLHPLRDPHGKPRYLVIALEDIAREKRLDEELNQALQTLEQSQQTMIKQESLRAIGQMASGIAHDFNNLLAPILGFSELLLKMPSDARDNDKIESFLKKIHVAAQDGAAVVSRLREFYRSQTCVNERNLIQPEILFEQVKDLTRHRWKTQSETKGIHIDFHIEVQTKRFLSGNESELRQALANLAINAVDAIDDNGSVLIRAVDQEENICIEIIDTGRGMSKNDLDNCIDPFYTTKGKLGTGLGLSIVFGTVKSHGGEIDIDSALGEGTRVTITLPAADGEGTDQSTPEPRKETPSLRVMLVDDEPVLLEVLSELLQSGGHEVECFDDPRIALKEFRHQEYDLVVTDWAMPNMNGDKLAEELKKRNPKTPIYLATGFGDIFKETKEKPDHIDVVLAKPIPLDVLNEKLAELTVLKTESNQ